MPLSDDKIRELDIRLLKLALSEFDNFCQIAGVDKVQAYVCMEKAKGKSNGTIANVLGISRVAIYKRGKRCKPCEN